MFDIVVAELQNEVGVESFSPAVSLSVAISGDDIIPQDRAP